MGKRSAVSMNRTCCQGPRRAPIAPRLHPLPSVKGMANLAGATTMTGKPTKKARVSKKPPKKVRPQKAYNRSRERDWIAWRPSLTLSFIAAPARCAAWFAVAAALAEALAAAAAPATVFVRTSSACSAASFAAAADACPICSAPVCTPDAICCVALRVALCATCAADPIFSCIDPMSSPTCSRPTWFCKPALKSLSPVNVLV
mmetsp:Transcript_140/g.424  ORF Transcript_140/g.424 Transcript_140/m.424 type:complete len:202 (-) Transcript_140:182-787(-)